MWNASYQLPANKLIMNDIIAVEFMNLRHLNSFNGMPRCDCKYGHYHIIHACMHACVYGCLFSFIFSLCLTHGIEMVLIATLLFNNIITTLTEVLNIYLFFSYVFLCFDFICIDVLGYSLSYWHCVKIVWFGFKPNRNWKYTTNERDTSAE